MGSTANNAIPYVEPTDRLTDFPAAMESQSDKIDGLLGMNLPWTNFASPVSGTTRYRVVNGVVFVQVDGSATTTSGTELVVSTSPLPATIRPTANARAGAYFSGYVGLLWVTGAGQIGALQQTGGNRSSVSGIVCYPLG